MNQNDREARRRRERMNSLKLRHPETSEMLTLDRNGRSGPFCGHRMRCLNDSAAVFLRQPADGAGDGPSAEGYLRGS